MFSILYHNGRWTPMATSLGPDRSCGYRVSDITDVIWPPREHQPGTACHRNVTSLRHPQQGVVAAFVMSVSSSWYFSRRAKVCKVKRLFTWFVSLFFSSCLSTGSDALGRPNSIMSKLKPNKFQDYTSDFALDTRHKAGEQMGKTT